MLSTVKNMKRIRIKLIVINIDLYKMNKKIRNKAEIKAKKKIKLI